MNPGPRFQCRTCKKYCKAAEKAVKCEDCEKRFHASCVNLGPVELQKIESGKSLPVHPFNALIFPILRDCLQSVCIFLLFHGIST